MSTEKKKSKYGQYLKVQPKYRSFGKGIPEAGSHNFWELGGNLINDVNRILETEA